MQPANPPQWIRDALAHREQLARADYRMLCESSDVLTRLVSEEEHVQRWLRNANELRPLTWTSYGSQEAPAR